MATRKEEVGANTYREKNEEYHKKRYDNRSSKSNSSLALNKMMQSQGLIMSRCIKHLYRVSSNNNARRRGGGIVTINAWNSETIEGESTNSFECEANIELYRYFLLQEPIAVLLLIDKQAKWNQELENVYLISCEHIENNCQHYEYELRPDNGCL